MEENKASTYTNVNSIYIIPIKFCIEGFIGDEGMQLNAFIKYVEEELTGREYQDDNRWGFGKESWII